MNSNINVRRMQAEKTYNSARSWALLVFVLSVVNVVSIATSETYFLFSSYVSQILTVLGLEFSAISEGNSAFLIVFGVLAVLVAVPYLLCFIFSKKHRGWLIAALVLFSIDTLILLVDVVSVGFQSGIIDVVLHGVTIFLFAAGVGKGKELARLEAMAQAEAFEAQSAQQGDAPEGEENPFYSDTYRTLTLTRKKAFPAALVPFVCYINGQMVGVLKNGETLSVNVPATELHLLVTADNGVSPEVCIPASDMSVSYTVRAKMGFSTLQIIIE